MDVMTQHLDSSEPHNTHCDGWRHTSSCPYCILAQSVSLLLFFFPSFLPSFLTLHYSSTVCVCALVCDLMHLYVRVCISVHVCEIDWYPVLNVTWFIDVQSKHCSFACMPLEGRVNEASVARSACFFIIERERERVCSMCAH